ncbi:MAG TPA: AAA family ATPase [Nannocystis sp.]|jgi:predicted ATPase
MLRTFHVENFKCLRDTTVELEPFTVLIGPNDSGKTSILDALRLIGQTFVKPVDEVFSGQNRAEVLAWRRQAGTELGWQLRFAEGKQEFNYRYSWPSGKERADSPRVAIVEKDGTKTHLGCKSWNGMSYVSASFFSQHSSADTGLRTVLCYPNPSAGIFIKEVQPFTSVLADLRRYRLDPDALRTPAVPEPDAVLTPSGDNLVAVLDRLISGPDRTAIVNLEQKLHEAIPTLRGIALRTADGKTGTKTLEFVLDGPGKAFTTIPCAHASDGAMLLTAFLALAYSEQPGMLLIEEPENGLHPSRLRAVVEMLRKLSTGEVGTRPRQVILTTHSPLLLNYTKPEEVRIVRRDPATGTHVTPLTAVPDIHKLLEEFAVGELWYLLGEEALVEGKKP